ncbi:DNA internalization-related competence protein ComEC/Rec2 [Colidextribacter sp. OB.20]|uniref:DNA internalization-related competence protein ComEC/Rec2 n=1 Tax=Colidextribacter sp. OB.20 TaxID=2304568 RepID=UPI00136AC9A4|nr:DNA internalization-related competence protein ComEC/Rec2 [Colidextribacter sp. OB.20]
MRILAAFAFSFSAAIFLTIYGGLDLFLLPLGAILILAAAAGWIALRRREGHVRLRTALILSGLAAGFLWTALYMAVFFQPARDLDGRTVRLTATVSDWPQEGAYGGCTVVVQAETESWVKLSAILYTDEQGAGLRPGDRVQTVARCTLGDRTFAGERITYYTAKGVFFRAQAYGRLDVQRPDHVPPQYYAAWAAKALREGIAAAFPEDAAGFVQALVTGNRSSLTDEFTTSLERTGLSHTVAVSGMHLAFLSSLLTALLGRGRRSTALLTILWVFLFCGIAGNTPSVLRAAVMVLMLQLAPLLDRERDGPTSLALALMLLLWLNPFSAAHIGLQLSFAAVAGILLVSDQVQDRLVKLFRLDKRPKNRREKCLRAAPYFAVSTLSATLGASLLTIPLVAVHFNMISLISPLSNLLTLWAIGFLFLGGLAAGALGAFLPGAAAVLAIPFTGLVYYLQWVIDLLSRPALAALPLDSVCYRAWVVLVYALLLVSVRVKGRRPLWMPAAAGAVTLVLAVALTRAAFYVGDMAVAVLDVGQGQSVLVRTGRYLTLVDCGGDSRDNPGDVAADYLQALGRSEVDMLVVSHYHADHANGVPQLLRRVRVGTICLPDVEEDSPLRAEIVAAAEERDIQVLFIREDLPLEMGSGKVLVLPPMSDAGTANELGLTVLATVGRNDVLITGDMEAEGERRLAESAALPDIEVLVAGHHGSDTSNTRELLEKVKPELALISVGLNNKYGHPGAGALDRLHEAGAEIYRTDLHGTIEVQLK